MYFKILEYLCSGVVKTMPLHLDKIAFCYCLLSRETTTIKRHTKAISTKRLRYSVGCASLMCAGMW